MNRDIVVIAGSIPATMFILANVGGSTATMTGRNDEAIRQAMGITSVAMLIAIGATGNFPAVLSAGLAIAAVFYAMRNVWQTPVFNDD